MASGESTETNLKTFVLFLKILTACAAVFFIYYFLAGRYSEYIPKAVSNLLFDAHDKYMDFFNQIAYAKDLNPYVKGPGFDSPLFIYAAHFIEKIFPAAADVPQEFRYMKAGQILFAAYTGLALAIYAFAFNGLFSAIKVEVKRRAWFYIAFILSYPVIFAVDRGNYVFLTSAFIALFITQFIEGRTYIAAMLLAVAVALKYYPAVFGIIFLINKKWMEALVCALVSCLLLLFCLGQFQGGVTVNLNLLLKNLAQHQSAGAYSFGELASHNTSIYMLFDIPAAIVKKAFGADDNFFVPLHNTVKYLAYGTLALTAIISCVPKFRQHDRFLLLACGIVLFPLMAGDYMIPIIIVPALYWILNEREDHVMPWLAGLYFICKRYYSFYNKSDLLSVTIQSIHDQRNGSRHRGEGHRQPDRRDPLGGAAPALQPRRRGERRAHRKRRRGRGRERRADAGHRARRRSLARHRGLHRARAGGAHGRGALRRRFRGRGRERQLPRGRAMPRGRSARSRCRSRPCRRAAFPARGSRRRRTSRRSPGSCRNRPASRSWCACTAGLTAAGPRA